MFDIAAYGVPYALWGAVFIILTQVGAGPVEGVVERETWTRCRPCAEGSPVPGRAAGAVGLDEGGRETR